MRQYATTGICFATLLLIAGTSVLATTAESSERSVATSIASPGAPVFGKTIKLFNGTNLAGWTGFFQDKSTDASQAWSVRDGILVCNGQPIGYLQTDLQFENYELC